MELFCQSCNKMPLIKFSFIKEGKILVIINCKCGRKFHDVSTFIADYTNILKTEKEKEINNNEKENENKINIDDDLIGFCETCFENIYNNNSNNNSEHYEHKLIKINKESLLISNEEFEKISENLKLAENKILKYLPEMKDMLLKDCKSDKEKKEIECSAEINIYKNNLILSFLKLVYNLYSINKEKKTLTYQIIQNLKDNCDYNLNKYNLDLKNICKERFLSFLKSCMILCCNSYINKIYDNYIKNREELKKMILDLSPYKEVPKEKSKENDKEINTKNDKDKEKEEEPTIFIDEIIKSNNSIYYGEKSKKNNLAYGRGFLYCSSGSHYFGYFKDDFFQSGYGKTINKNGNIYLGGFSDGVANGPGKFMTKNGNVYKGFWSDNKLNGIGFINWENGKSYIGEINKGIFNGIGELYYKNGNVYRGEFKNGRMDGIGKIVYRNKKEYLGEFKEGSKSGFGIMKWPTEEVYEGSWEKDSFKFGQYIWPNGNIYFGNFENDSVNGYGTFYSSSMNTIETGIWKDGRRVQITDKENIPSTRYLSFI